MNLSHELLQQLGERLLAPESSPQVKNAVINILCQFSERAGDLAASVAVIAEDQGQTRDHQADFFVLKVSPRSGTERRDAFLVQGVNERAAVFKTNAVQQQRHL